MLRQPWFVTGTRDRTIFAAIFTCHGALAFHREISRAAWLERAIIARRCPNHTVKYGTDRPLLATTELAVIPRYTTPRIRLRKPGP
jgi:hypothetical protein